MATDRAPLCETVLLILYTNGGNGVRKDNCNPHAYMLGLYACHHCEDARGVKDECSITEAAVALQPELKLRLGHACSRSE